MADRINFFENINDSVQVGDELYWATVSGTTIGTPNPIGTITGIGDKYIEVGNGNAPTLFVSGAMFFMFRKPVGENVSSLKGYYAQATFTNSSLDPQELFAVGSEVTMSSK